MSFMTSLDLIFNVAEIWRKNVDTSFLSTVFLLSSQEMTWANTFSVSKKKHTSLISHPNE